MDLCIPADQLADSLRVAACRRCGQVFFFCRFCDRGDRYCNRRCSAASRAEALAQAGRRYQSSRLGRFALAQRQARWRAKQKVTHQGAQGRNSSVGLLLPFVALASSAPANSKGREYAHGIDLRRSSSPTGCDPDFGAVGPGDAAAQGAGWRRSRRAGWRCRRCWRSWHCGRASGSALRSLWTHRSIAAGAASIATCFPISETRITHSNTSPAVLRAVGTR